MSSLVSWDTYNETFYKNLWNDLKISLSNEPERYCEIQCLQGSETETADFSQIESLFAASNIYVTSKKNVVTNNAYYLGKYLHVIRALIDTRLIMFELV